MIKSFILGLFFLFISLTVIADENCNRVCLSDANQIGLQCQKMRQYCFRVGSPDSVQFEMCMDDVGACLQNGKAIFDSCNLACSKEN